MPIGDKNKHTDKQKRPAAHTSGSEKRVVSKNTGGKISPVVKKVVAAKIAKKVISASAKADKHEPGLKARAGGHTESQAKRSAAAKKGWLTRRRNAVSSR